MNPISVISRGSWRANRGTLLVASFAVAFGGLALPVGPGSDAAPAANGSGPAVVDTIDLPGAQPLAVGVYETGNKIYVADDNSGNLIVLHGTTREVLTTIPVGAAVFDIAIDESMGKVYTASSDDPFTTGVGDGNGLVSVIDADTDTIVNQIDPAGPSYPGKAKFFTFGHDEAHDRLYLTFYRPAGGDNVGEIGADDTFTTIDATVAALGVSGIEVNTVTHTAYIAYYTGNDLLVIDGSTLGVTTENLGYTGGQGPLDIAVNEVENKVYLTMMSVPGQGGIGILVLDLDNGSYVFRGADDLEPLTFNPATNRLFSGVQVGEHGAVVDGVTDVLTYVDLGGSGMGAGDVRRSTDNAYFASSDETFVVNGSTMRHRKFSAAPTGGGAFASSVTIDQTRGLVYVVNNDQDGVITVIHDAEIPAPTLSVNDVTIAEWDAGSWTATFTVSLSERTGRDVIFHYETTSGTATPGADYTAVAGTETIPAESLTTSVTVPVLGDSLDEAVETFFLDLSDPTNATIVDGQGLGTITDDDPLPSLSIVDVIVTEGNSGTTDASFTVSLSTASGRPVSFDYATAAGTATPGDDYTTASGTGTMAPGQTSKTLTIQVKGDTLDEADETFFVDLAGSVNATIADGHGVAAVVDDDLSSSLSIDDVTVTEGDSGTREATFTVSLSAASSTAVSFDFATSTGTASAGTDFNTVAGTRTIPAGQTARTVSVQVRGDVRDEFTETYFVDLAGPVNATIADARGLGTIADDDPLAAVSIRNTSTMEGDSRRHKLFFRVVLSAPSEKPVAVEFRTFNGTAKAPSDYVGRSGTVRFATGVTARRVYVYVKGDRRNEPKERFFVRLKEPVNASIADRSGRGLIRDDD